MRLVGWPTNCNSDDGLFPVDIQDIDFHATADELRALARFLEQAADQVENAKLNSQQLNVGIDFGDSKPNPQTGIWVNVVSECD